MSDRDYIFLTWLAAPKEKLDFRIKELSKHGWDRATLSEIRKFWADVKKLENDSAATFNADQDIVDAAIRHEIVTRYSYRWLYPAFNPLTVRVREPFKPVPNVPALMSIDKEAHYLWFSEDLKEILIQLWIYLGYDEARFNSVTKAVWSEYRQYTKYQCGHAGESDKIAARLRFVADTLNK